MSDCPQPKWPSFFAQFLGSSGPLHGFFLPGTKLERRPKLSSMIFGVRCTGNRHLTHLPMKGWNLKINPPPKEETSWIIGQTPIEKGGFQLFRRCFWGKTLSQHCQYPEHSGIFPKDPNHHWNFLQDFLARLQMLVPPKKHLQTWRFSPPQKIDNQKFILKQNPWRSQKQKLLGISSIFGTFFCFIVLCLRSSATGAPCWRLLTTRQAAAAGHQILVGTKKWWRTTHPFVSDWKV